jgi:hypothetical protein
MTLSSDSSIVTPEEFDQAAELEKLRRGLEKRLTEALTLVGTIREARRALGHLDGSNEEEEEGA